MVVYSEDGNTAEFDGKKYRKDQRTGYYLCAVHTGGFRKRLHVAVWESYNGPVPDGMHVHHIDGNKDNNGIENLSVIDAIEHATLHGRNLSDELREFKRKNVVSKAMPAAKQWHSTKDGHDWHVEHAKAAWIGKKPATYTCVLCGKEFTSMKSYSEEQNKFCSNNCRSAFRKRSGIDNETRECVVCGKKFTVNRYAKTKTCSRECAYKSRGK